MPPPVFWSMGEKMDPILIHNWEELGGLRSPRYRIALEPDKLSAWIRPIVEDLESKQHPERNNYYLSTHTFRPGFTEEATMALRRFGFNVKIVKEGETK